MRWADHVGIPTAASALLLGFILFRLVMVLDKLVENDALIVINQQTIIKSQSDVAHLLREHERTTSQMQRMVLCLSLATSDADRVRCFQER